MSELKLDEEKDLFDTLDVSQTGALSFEEFFQGMMLIMQGSEPAKAKDFVSTYLTCQAMHVILRDIRQIAKSGGADPGACRQSQTNEEDLIYRLQDVISEKFFALEEKFESHTESSDTQNTRLESKIERVATHLDSKIDAVATRIGADVQ